MMIKLKRILLILVLIFFANQIVAQTTNGIFFQAVARDNFSNPAKDRQIYVQSSIIQTTVTGTKVLIETHKTNTDAMGVFSINIGNGIRTGGTAASIAAIDWANGPFYLNLKIAITPFSASDNWDFTKELVDIGTTSFGAVPFAFYSASSAKVSDKLDASDTTAMLKTYAKAMSVKTLETSLATKLTAADTLTMLAPYAKAAYTIDSNFFKTQLATKLSLLDTIKYTKKSYTDSVINKKLNITDTSNLLKKIDTSSLSNRINLKLNIADSTKYVTPSQLAAKTFDQTPITNAIATKLNIADSTKYITPTQLSNFNFSSGAVTIDTSSLSNRINLKANATEVNSLSSSVASKLNIADSTKYVTPTQLAAKTFDQTPISNAIATKLNIADSTKYVTPTQLAAKIFDTTSLSSRINSKANADEITNLTTALGTKLNITDTAYLLRKADTSNLSNRINLKLNASQLGVANGVASLNASGIIPSSQLPPVTISSTSVVGSDIDMIALSSATVGSIAIRTDLNKNYILTALPASTLLNWVELLTPAAPVQTVNGYTGSINLSKIDIDLSNVNNTSDLNKPVSTATKAALDLKLDANKVGANSGVASLNALGKIPTDQIPAISFSSVKVLASQAEMLALTNAVVGSVVIRTDLNKNFVLAQAKPTILSNWIELLTPAPPVQSVNGMTGSVSITKSTIDLDNVNNTTDANKPISIATQTALGAKADTAVVNPTLLLKAPLASPKFTGSVAIGTNTPSSSAALDITSTSQGLLLPRLTYVQKTAIVNPVAGLILFCSDCGTNGEMQLYNGTSFVNMIGNVAQLALPAISSTTGASSITTSSAISGGVINSDGGAAITARGIVWGTSAGSSTFSATTGTGVGTYTSSMTGLTSGTTYYVRAYARNSVGTKYGPEISFNTSQAVATLAATTTVSLIGATTATSGGNITYNGGATVSVSGIVWSTISTPTIALATKTTNGAATGTFTSTITGLTPGTLYYVRSYATNSVGTNYGAQTSFTTLNTPTISATASATSITSSTATTGGTITADGGAAVTERGIVYGTSTRSATFSVTTGTGTGTYTISLTGLLPATTYYVRSFATNSVGTVYGTETSFTTIAVEPTVSATTAAASITGSSATSGGTIISNGGATITASGVVWSTTATPTIALATKTTNGAVTGTYTSSITGLAPATLYYVRAYATNSIGTAYGPERSFTTLAIAPTISGTSSATSITSSSASVGGTITSDGGASVTSRGVVYGTSSGSSTLSVTTGTGTGTYTSSLTGLTPATTYFVRSFATNSVATVYGAETSFTTIAIAPTLTTTAASSITKYAASAGGTITSNGGSVITASGICWSTTATPTTSNFKTTDGTTSETFTSSLTGLTAGTVYYVRAYATNAIGTSYGAAQSFTTLSSSSNNPALASTTSATSITPNSAILGGNVTDEGATQVSVRGLVYGTSTGASTFSVTVGSGAGTFTGTITGLTQGATYYVRSFATNVQGTSYGAETSFTTQTTPTVSVTATPTSLTTTSAIGGGTISSTGGATITTSGLVWDASVNPTIALATKTTDGATSGTFTSSITGLTQGTTYHVRAYATNYLGTSYGPGITFTTLTLPTVSATASISAISGTTATGGGTISSDGGATVTSRGVVWGTTTGSSTYSVTSGTGTGTFTSSLTGLTPATTYYVRAFATNSVGTVYGPETSFVSTATAPILSTTAASSIGKLDAVSGGTISSNGGSAITASGICWSTSATPTIANSKTTDGTTSGTFTSTMTGLAMGTTYYVRAYATNSIGTAYGAAQSFTTLPFDNVPTAANPVTNGLMLYLDATRSASYSGSGNTWADISGLTPAGNATLVGSPVFGSSSLANGSGSFVFGSNINALTTKTYTIDNEITYIAWVNPSQSFDGGVIVRRTDPGFGNGATSLYLANSNLSYDWDNANWSWRSNLMVPNNQWSMIVISVNAGSVTAYLCNSSGINSASSGRGHSSLASKPATNFHIGYDPYSPSGRAFKGKMGTAMVYSVALTSSDITAIFNAQKASFGL